MVESDNNLGNGYEETKYTKICRINNRKYRVSYIPHKNNDTLSIKIENNIADIISCVSEIIKLNKYRKIKIYSKEELTDCEFDNLMSRLNFDNYTIEFTASMHNQEMLSKDLVLVLVKQP